VEINMIYRREIDGLRAIAVLAVIFFHAGFSSFKGGYVGVDIFFVISGYLISDLIIRDVATNNFSIREFYGRRVRRIFPALFLMLLLTIPISWCVMSPAELKNYGASLVSVPIFASNVFFWREAGYFQPPTDMLPLLHTWSLAVEEQFYVIFPYLIIVLWTLKRNVRIAVLTVLFLMSITIAQALSASKPMAAFYLLPTRGWEFLIGTAAAMLISTRTFQTLPKCFFRLGGTLGLSLIFFSVSTFSNSTRNPGLITFIPTVGALLIILFSTQGSLSSKFLGNRAFVGVGLVSYSAYLWHQPIFAFSRHIGLKKDFLSSFFIILVLIFLSILSWKYIEQPFRDRNRIKARELKLLSCLSIIAITILGGISLRMDTDFEKQMAKSLVSNPAVFSTNINERLFIKYRIQYENKSPDSIIVGSSRLMQVGNGNNPGTNLNLSVSGASIEDIVAISTMASNKFKSKVFMISADPWLFNSNSGQNRWVTLNKEYEAALNSLSIQKGLQSVEPKNVIPFNSFFTGIYNWMNSGKIASSNDSAALTDKIRQDGSRVYNVEYASQASALVARDSISALSYGMTDYNFSRKLRMEFEAFLLNLKNAHQVVLVLSPYHPKAYTEMVTKSQNFTEIEKIFRDISVRTGVQIIGSYNPLISSCNYSEFFDGMHPKETCMEKVLLQLK